MNKGSDLGLGLGLGLLVKPNTKSKNEYTTLPMPIEQIYNVSQINNLYGFNQLPYKEVPNGPNINIVIVIAYSYPNLQNDLDKFCEINNIASRKLNIVKLNPNTPSSDSWVTEICLDTQWLHAICPYANITVVEANSDLVDDLIIAIQKANSLSPKPNIINISWGIKEFDGCDSIDIFDPEIMYIAASGDDNYVAWPSSNPNILSVSATTLITNSTGTEFIGQTTWSSSGCGPSKYFKIPDYQKNNVKKINSNYRLTSDVCIDGNPKTGLYIYSEGSYFGIGGTSVSAPLICGTMAIIFYQRLLKNLPLYNSNQNDKLGIQNIIYNIYGKNLNNIYNKLFYDVTQGLSGNYSASLGYDYPTGLGTPYVPNFVPYLINNNGILPTLKVDILSSSEVKYKNKDNSTGTATSLISVSATSNDLSEKDILEQKLIVQLEQSIIPHHFSTLIDKEKIEKYDFNHYHSTSFDFI